MSRQGLPVSQARQKVSLLVTSAVKVGVLGNYPDWVTVAHAKVYPSMKFYSENRTENKRPLFFYEDKLVYKTNSGLAKSQRSAMLRPT